MNASEKVAEVYSELESLDSSAMDSLTAAERIVYDVVAARRAQESGGFAAACARLKQSELKSLFNSLKQIGETGLANDVRQAFQVLKDADFYSHRDWAKVAVDAKREVDQIGNRIGERLSQLDDKLAKALDDPDLHPQYEE